MARKKKSESKTTTSKKRPKINLEKVASELSSKIGDDSSVVFDEDSLNQSIPHISTGCIALDYLIGGRENEKGVKPCPGIPRGRFSLIYGLPGSGKTTIALQTCATICNDGGTAIYIDWENEVEPKYAQALGVPITDRSKFILYQPTTLEEGLTIMVKMAEQGVDLIIMDSIGAAVPREFFEKKEGDTPQIGLNARKWSNYLPKFKKVVKKYDTSVLAISQLRDNIGAMGYGNNYTIQGGKAWKFFNSLQIMLKVVGSEKGKIWNPIQGKFTEQIIGNKVRAKLDKCKVSSAMKNEIEFYVMSGIGTDNKRTIVELGINTGVIKKRGAWFSWNGPNGEVKGQGLPNFLEMIEDHIDSIFTEVRPYLSDPSSVVDKEEKVDLLELDDDDDVNIDDLLEDLK